MVWTLECCLRSNDDRYLYSVHKHGEAERVKGVRHLNRYSKLIIFNIIYKNIID